MRVISTSSVSDAFHKGSHHLLRFSTEQESRNGPVFVSSMPVMTVYEEPRNRVLVNEDRDANPFFHLFESMWMLAGNNDLEFCTTFIPSFDKFSDDGETLWGAYGFRWRNWFGYDQLTNLVDMLKADPQTRRAVLSMWDAGGAVDSDGDPVTPDLHRAMSGGRDVPCNTHAYFDTLDGRLNMTVCCRSNDMVLGAYGANAVHFSILLEYMSAATGIPMGVYRQFSNNYHAYTELYSRILDGNLTRGALARLGDRVKSTDIYDMVSVAGARVTPRLLLQEGEAPAAFLKDCEFFCEAVVNGSVSDVAFATSFFNKVVAPMYKTWRLWKNKDYEGAQNMSLHIEADDWRAAAQSWLLIRDKRRAKLETV